MSSDQDDPPGSKEPPVTDGPPPQVKLENLPLDRVPKRVRQLLLPPGGGQQEAGAKESGGRPVGPPNDLDEQAISRKVRGMGAARKAARQAGVSPDDFSKKVARSLVVQARDAMARMAAGATDGSLSLQDTVALEAVLHTRGRPALRVEGDGIEAITDQTHPGSSFWMPLLDDHELAIVSATSATGAVHVAVAFGDTFIQGTAWLVKDELVITNRHVLFPPHGERLARRLEENPLAARLKSGVAVSIDFGFDNGPPGRKLICRVLDVPFVSAETDPIDVAVLRIDPTELSALPKPLTISSQKFDRDQLYIIGHPGKLRDIPSEVNAVFGSPDERKRVSFGELMDADAARPSEYIHDASTIGGFSGGCMLGFGFGEREVVGLHHFGSTVSGNRAFKSTALLAHPVAQFLK